LSSCCSAILSPKVLVKSKLLTCNLGIIHIPVPVITTIIIVKVA
jgi:hypothetical protein